MAQEVGRNIQLKVKVQAPFLCHSTQRPRVSSPMAWSQDGTSPSSTTYMWNLGHGSDCNLSVLFGDTRTVSKILLTSRQRTVGLCWGPENKGSKEILDPFRKLSLIMASGPITSWEIDGETVTDFIFLGSKITADGDCSHEIKRCCSLEEKLWTT